MRIPGHAFPEGKRGAARGGTDRIRIAHPDNLSEEREHEPLHAFRHTDQRWVNDSLRFAARGKFRYHWRIDQNGDFGPQPIQQR